MGVRARTPLAATDATGPPAFSTSAVAAPGVGPAALAEAPRRLADLSGRAAALGRVAISGRPDERQRPSARCSGRATGRLRARALGPKLSQSRAEAAPSHQRHHGRSDAQRAAKLSEKTW